MWCVLCSSVAARSEVWPAIGEGELAVVYFIINWNKHCALKPARGLVTHVDTDQPILILLAMAMSVPSAVGIDSDSRTNVTVKRVVQRRTD